MLGHREVTRHRSTPGVREYSLICGKDKTASGVSSLAMRLAPWGSQALELTGAAGNRRRAENKVGVLWTASSSVLGQEGRGER